MSIRFEANVTLYIEVELPDEFFIDETTGHPITAAEYITKHLYEYRHLFEDAEGMCVKAVALEDAEE